MIKEAMASMLKVENRRGEGDTGPITCNRDISCNICISGTILLNTVNGYVYTVKVYKRIQFCYTFSMYIKRGLVIL